MLVKKIVFDSIFGTGTASWGASIGNVRLLNSSGVEYNFGTLTNVSRTESTFINGSITASDAYTSGSNYYVGYAFDNLITASASSGLTYYLSASKTTAATITILFTNPIDISSITMNGKVRSDNGISTQFVVNAYDSSGQLLKTYKPNSYTITQNVTVTVNLPEHPLALKSSISSMQIGDRISCEYIAPYSNTVGLFNNLGKATRTEISTSGVSTPNGTFYFVKVAKGLLIADRAVQTSVTWATLNTARAVEGRYVQPTFTSSLDFNGSISDQGGITWTASGGATVSTTQKFEGTHSLYTPTGGFIKATNSNFATGAEDFSVEFYMYYAGTGYSGVCSSLVTGSTNGFWIQPDFVGFGSNTTSTTISTSGYFVSNQWANYKLIRFNNVAYYFVNGELKASGTVTTWSLASDSIAINSRYSNDAGYTGSQAYYDKFKFTKGISIDDKKVIMRILSGGVAFNDGYNSRSLTNVNIGGYPKQNEWDTYIKNSTLGGNNVWNYSNTEEGIGCHTSDTPHITIAASTTKVLRGNEYVKSFDGANSYIFTNYVPYATISTSTHTFSFEISKPSKPISTQTIVSYFWGGRESIDITTNGFIRYYNYASNIDRTFSTNICDGVWHTISLEINSVTNKLILTIDGVSSEQTIPALQALPNTDYFAIGCNQLANGTRTQYFAGKLSNFMLRDNTNTPVLIYRLNEPSTTANETSGNGYSSANQSSLTNVLRANPRGLITSSTNTNTANLSGFRPVLEYEE